MLGLTLISASACDEEPETLQIAAASDLRALLETHRGEVESAAGAPVTFVFGSSGQLKEQVLAGAKYGLFLSADVAFVDELERAERLALDGRASYGVGALALVWRDGIPAMNEPRDLGRPDLQRVTIANPGHAPYGRAARQLLTELGLWDELQRRLVLAEHVRQATDYVRTGNADAGLVALALVITDEQPYVLVDRRLHDPIVQAGGVIAGSGWEQEARRVLDFLVSSRGQEVLATFGFEAAP
jgi:molybdate transport system substrate-binding protein